MVTSIFEESMSLLFWSAISIAWSSVIGSWFETATPARSALGSGGIGASKLGATGGGSDGKVAGGTAPDVPTFCPGVCWITVFGFVTVPLGVVPGGFV